MPALQHWLGLCNEYTLRTIPPSHVTTVVVELELRSIILTNTTSLQNGVSMLMDDLSITNGCGSDSTFSIDGMESLSHGRYAQVYSMLDQYAGVEYKFLAK